MRERTTWNRQEIAKKASGMAKKADPYTMNQPEHAKAQPAHDKYVTGTPSDFGEDVHPSTGTWEAEYSGGEVKRNEIGMGEFRGDTWNHAEKTAASEQITIKKAALCVRIARKILPKTASESVIEDQAISLMSLPDAEVVSTYNRLAADDEDEDQGQEKQAQQDDQDQAQEKQAQQDDQDQAQQKQAQQDQGEKKDQAEQKQAGQMPPQFKENAEKKKEEAKDKKDDGQDQGQKQAALLFASKDFQAGLANFIANQVQQQLAQQGQQQQGQPMAQGQQDQMQMAQQQQMAQQVQQQMAQQQGQQQQQMAQQQPVSDDQILDQMMADMDGGGQQMPMSDEIELDSPSMDTGEAVLTPEDDQLMQLFASNPEAQDAQEAEQSQGKQASYGVRTASTRTIGARPTGGVSRLGGIAAPNHNQGANLSSLWSSSPDVSDVFGTTKSL